jgi:mRNA-degrading endonuclease RelE of RelBE toxin-antitoxin system
MEIRLTSSFEADYKELPRILQKTVDRKLLLLLENFKYPSLRVKKMDGYKNVWEIRVSRGYRLTFSISDTAYIIRRVGPHDILKRP